MDDNLHLVQERVTKLELELMRSYPDEYVPKFVNNIKDIYHYRHSLKRISFTQSSFDYLLNLIFTAVQNRVRFRTLDSLLVIKKIKRDKVPEDFRLPKATVDKLFYLYQTFVTHRNDEIMWAVSVFLQNQILSNWQLEWLLESCDENVNILNRVLRYPERHPLITEWAKAVYEEKRHTDRQSEVITLLIDDDIPKYIDMTNRSTILWAIYYARVSDDIRQRLLKKTWDVDSLDDLIKICERLHYPDVLNHARAELVSGKHAGA